MTNTKITTMAITILLLAPVAHATQGPPGRFSTTTESTSDGTISVVDDNMTGLRWEQFPSALTFVPSSAAERCSSLGPNWRIPTLLESMTIINPTRDADISLFDDTAFPNTAMQQKGSYIVTSAKRTSHHLFSPSGFFGVSRCSSSCLGRVRCVRD